MIPTPTNGPATPPRGRDLRPGSLSRLGITGLAIATALGGGAIGVVGGLLLGGSPGSCDTRQVASKALPAVVTIFAEGAGGAGSGSGAIIQEDGLVITNDHVIAPAGAAGAIDVLLTGGDREPAVLVGTDPLTDLAVLRIDRDRLPTLPIAPREPLSIGQPVVALGAPLGLSGTVTSGIVSALNRNIPVPKASGGTTVLASAIQTDAAINPGNSGGPLVTCRGLLVGINTAISTVPSADGGGGGSIGIGFAVPASTARRIVDELVASGRATHPWIGAATAEVSAEVAAGFGTEPGLFVQEVTADGPAGEAGLQVGDLITDLAGGQATSVALAWLLVTAAVGDEVPVAYLRDGVRLESTITLAEQP